MRLFYFCNDYFKRPCSSLQLWLLVLLFLLLHWLWVWLLFPSIFQAQAIRPPPPTLLQVVDVVFIAPFIEEAYFRAFMLGIPLMLARKHVHRLPFLPLLFIGLSGLVFGLAHLIDPKRTLSEVLLLQSISGVFTGIVFAKASQLGKDIYRGTHYSILDHMLWNASVTVFIYLR